MPKIKDSISPCSVEEWPENLNILNISFTNSSSSLHPRSSLSSLVRNAKDLGKKQGKKNHEELNSPNKNLKATGLLNSMHGIVQFAVTRKLGFCGCQSKCYHDIVRKHKKGMWLWKASS